MSVPQAEQMLAGYEGLNRGDLGPLTAHWDDDITFVFPGKTRISGTYQGRHNAERCFWIIQQIMPDIKFEIVSVVDGPDTVIVEWIKRSTTVQGDVFENAGITVAEFRDDKVIAMRDYLDTYYLGLHFEKKGSKRGGRVQAA